MENSVFSIILRRKNRVFINDNDMLKSLSGAAGEKNKQIVATMNKNIEVFGYTMSEALFDKLVHMKAKSREVVYDILVNGLKEITGADKVYNPMYPNFPESVMKKDDFELYFNAIVHYWSFGTLLPYEEKEERAPLFNTAKVKVLEAGSFNDLNDIFNNLCASKTSLSKNDVDDMIFILNSVKVTLPDEIPFKENAACVCRLLVDTGVDTDGSLCKKYVKTATDILRLITAMSDGDVSLAENTKFRNLKRSERRIAGKTMTAVSRGSRIAIDDSAKIIRPFIWWTNTKDNIIDVDLSIAVFADDWNCLEHVSYSNLKSSRFGICHSGDITNGGPVDGEGVAEFIDLDIEKALSAGARYAVFNVYNFSNENFSKMEHAAFGFMTRNDMKIGEIFEPSTVKQRMDLASATTTCIPVIFDLKERVFVWCDMALTADHVRAGYGGINVESNLPSVVVTCKAIVDVKKPNLYDLFTFNATARGVITDNPDEADIRFGLDDNCDVKPSDIDVIVGKYL